MCTPFNQKKTIISCPTCSAEMISSRIDPNSGRVKVVHFPNMKNVLKTSTFDCAEEIELTGLEYSREVRRRYADGRIFAANCTGLCLACHNPFTVYRIVHTSGPVPAEHSAVDFQHGYRTAEIYNPDLQAFAGAHLLEDVMHHGAYYGSWLECWSEAIPYATGSDEDVSNLTSRSLDAASSISRRHQKVTQVYRFEAGIN